MTELALAQVALVAKEKGQEIVGCYYSSNWSANTTTPTFVNKILKKLQKNFTNAFLVTLSASLLDPKKKLLAAESTKVDLELESHEKTLEELDTLIKKEAFLKLIDFD